MKRKLDYDKVLTMFGDIEFECGYYPMANDEMSVFDYITEDKIDLVRVIKESITEIESDVNIMEGYKASVLVRLRAEICD